MALRTSYVKTTRADKTSTFAGSVTIAGTLTVNGNFAFGDASADSLTLTGLTTVVTDQKIQFRDTGIFMNSGADGKLTISADGTGADDITFAGTVTANDSITMADAKNLSFNTTTGTKIGTAANQKMGFYNTAPVVQQTHVGDPAATASDTTNSTGGTPSGTHTLVDCTSSYDQALVEANFATLSAEYNLLKDDVEANNAAIDSVLGQLATLGLQASS